MKTYIAYGFAVRSEIPFPELVEAPPGVEPDIDVVYGTATRNPARPEMHIHARCLDYAKFELTDGRRIVVEELKSVDESVMRARLLGEIFAALLRQRGLLVLHACAIAGRGGAVCIMGESGWGKSTLAEAFRQRGYDLLTDDVAAFDMESGERPLVIPSYPQIRLRDDSAAFLEPSGEGLTAIMRNGPKMARADIDMASTPMPVVAAYFLEPGFRDETAIVDVTGQEALVHLVAHTRARTLVNDRTPGLLQQHFRQCTDFVRSVQPRLLQRRRSFEALDEVMEAVEADASVSPLRAPVRPLS